MKKLSLLILTLSLITPSLSLGTKKTDLQKQQGRNYIQRCPGTNQTFATVAERIKCFQEHFTARPIEKTMTYKRKPSIVYKCGIIACSSKISVFKNKKHCWKHMVVANKNHDKNVKKHLREESISHLIQQPVEKLVDQPEQLEVSKDEDDLFNSGDSSQSIEEEHTDFDIIQPTTSPAYSYFTDTFSENKIEPLFGAEENQLLGWDHLDDIPLNDGSQPYTDEYSSRRLNY